MRAVPLYSLFICLGGRWLLLGALWGLKLLLTPMPMWVLLILTGMWLLSGGILWYLYTLWDRTERESGQPAPPVFPEGQGGRTHSPVGSIFPVQLVVAVVTQVVVTAAAAETNGARLTVLGQSSYPDRNLTWGNRHELFLRSPGFSTGGAPRDLTKVTLGDHSKPASPWLASGRRGLPGGRRATGFWPARAKPSKCSSA